jgi:aerobic-type carbon monoxide dehydrogenase small subunit (CoxS/CutS family)
MASDHRPPTPADPPDRAHRAARPVEPAPAARQVELVVDGQPVVVPDDGSSLLDVLRERLHLTGAKDGCSPQGQCGCCTVLVDGAPRVACVTPARRVAGRAITTLDGLDPEVIERWADAFVATGASQCGFCTPGILLRFEGLRSKGVAADDEAAIERALQAHLCRCTGWRSIVDAYGQVASVDQHDQRDPGVEHDPGDDRGVGDRHGVVDGTDERSRADERAVPAVGRFVVGGRAAERDLDVASRRASIEGRTPQRVGPDVVVGRGGFAADTAPLDALVAVPDGAGGWSVGETLAEARLAAGKVQGRRTSAEAVPPLELPDGEWALTLRTSWVEPAYVETDASWCEPGGEPASPLANGGAFGGKVGSPVGAVARELADRHGRSVRVQMSREDAVRLGPKRPPIAAGVRWGGEGVEGVVRVVRTPDVADRIRAVAPGLDVVEVDVAGPPTSSDLRAAGWAEAAVLQVVATTLGPAPAHGDQPVHVELPGGGAATASIVTGGPAPGERVVRVQVSCGDPLDEVVLRSYCTGAAHMAIGWVTSEALAVDPGGEVHDLTIRSFGVPRAVDTPHIEVEVIPSDEAPVNGSDAVFAAVAAATWHHQGLGPVWPTGLPLRR